MSLEFIHYGHDKFDKDLFVPVKNVGFVKPIGGLWASPLYSNHSWRDWCIGEEFELHLLEKYFTFTIDKNAKIYTIDNLNHLRSLPTVPIKIINRKFLNFELISKDYDVIWLTANGERATRSLQPLNLYGWDVESLLVLNPNIIITDYGKIKS
jgi:hypothetical protein